MIRVFLIDDHPVVRQGMRALPSKNAEITIVGEAATAHEALQVLSVQEVDVVLMDARLPDMRTKELIQKLREHHPSIRILVLSAYQDAELVRTMLQTGIDGYLLKDEPLNRIAAAITEVMLGWKVFSPHIFETLQEIMGETTTSAEMDPLAELTPREREVLSLMAEGLSNATIASRLHISERTVKYHITNIYAKLGVKNRTEAILLALKH